MDEAAIDHDLEALIARGYRYALAMTHDVERAEDLVQDAWLAILRRGGPRHVGYLLRTIRNRFLDLEKRRRLVAVEALPTAGDLPAPDTAPLRIDLADVEHGLGDLRPAEREALYLAAVEGYTVAEIAELTDHPLGTASSLLRRGRAKLRRAVGRGPLARGPLARGRGSRHG